MITEWVRRRGGLAISTDWWVKRRGQEDFLTAAAWAAFLARISSASSLYLQCKLISQLLYYTRAVPFLFYPNKDKKCLSKAMAGGTNLTGCKNMARSCSLTKLGAAASQCNTGTVQIMQPWRKPRLNTHWYENRFCTSMSCLFEILFCEFYLKQLCQLFYGKN